MKMQSFADIQHVMYINLDSRPDRRTHIERQLKTLGLTTYERFPAIKLANGRAGCSMSHLKCIQNAKDRGYTHVLICEDDTEFLNPALVKTQFNTFLQSYPTLKWDVIMLAGNNVPPYKRFSAAAIQVTHCQTTTCYLVHHRYYDTLLQNIREGLNLLVRMPTQHFHYAIDKYWLRLQKTDRWFLITPPTVVQRDDYSDIEKKTIKYGRLMTDLDKPWLQQRKNTKGTEEGRSIISGLVK